MAKSRLSRVRISESYDLALYAVNCALLEVSLFRFGLTVSIPKTKDLALGAVSEGGGSRKWND